MDDIVSTLSEQVEILRRAEDSAAASVESGHASVAFTRGIIGLATTPGRVEAVLDMVTAHALGLAAAQAHLDAAVKQREATERLRCFRRDIVGLAGPETSSGGG
jgi:hypothetical protein